MFFCQEITSIIISWFCFPGHYVITCDEDYGRDRCEPCPDKTFLFDKTNSSSVHRCPKYDCPGK